MTDSQKPTLPDALAEILRLASSLQEFADQEVEFPDDLVMELIAHVNSGSIQAMADDARRYR